MNILLYGLLTGIVFGFLLQRGGVVRYDKQLAALRLQDMTIVKFMLSFIVVGMVGIYFFLDMGLVTLAVKATILGNNVVGGLVFGLGWAMLGYCPGTSAGALGEGRWDALFGILGMVVGAGVFAEFAQVAKHPLLSWGNFGKITLPQMINVSPWFVISALTLLILILFIFFEKKNL